MRVSFTDLTRVTKTIEFSGKVISLIYQLQICTINTNTHDQHNIFHV